jgi:hypothetical protein
MEPRVMAHSQTYRLRERMAEAAIGHGQEVRADLTGIRVSAQIADWRSAPDPKVGVIFFCTMGSIKVREVLAPGDGKTLPSEVVLEGLEVPEPGTYDIVNAVVHSNGALRVKVDSATRVVQRVRGLATADGWV